MEYGCTQFVQSDKKSDFASAAQSLCGIALKNTCPSKKVMRGAFPKALGNAALRRRAGEQPEAAHRRARFFGRGALYSDDLEKC